MKKGTIASALALVTTLCASSGWADSYAYVEGDNGPFGTLDLNTGAYTYLGTTSVFLSGLGTANGKLYGANYGENGPLGTLYSVNTANGNLTAVGSSGISYEDIGSTTKGLYAIGSDFNLYSVNPANGAATLVGGTGLSSFGGVFGESAGSSTLYITAGTELYSVSTTSGLATAIGYMSGQYMGALVQEGGILYGGQWPATAVDTLNTLTGAATTGPSVTGGLNSFWGLAPIPLTSSVPDETSTMSLLLGVVCFGGLLLRRSKIAV